MACTSNILFEYFVIIRKLHM